MNQRYAYDLIQTDEDGRSRPAGSSTHVENYYCYDEPIVAPADGTVVDTFDDGAEASRGGGISHLFKRDIRGSYVVVQHAPDEYSCLAHLVPGSVTVEPGDRVERGEELGRCGHSGNSSGPHLHFQLQDHPYFEVAASLPIRFEGVQTEWPGARPSIDVAGSESEHVCEDFSADVDDRERRTDDGSRILENDGLTAISAGQRVTYVGHDGDREAAISVSERDDRVEAPAPRSSSRAASAPIDAVRRWSYGLTNGGVIAFLAPIVASWQTVALLLVVATAVGTLWTVGTSLGAGGLSASSRSAATPIALTAGIAAATTIVALHAWTETLQAVSSGTVSIGLVLLGFLGYAVAAEYGRLRLRDEFVDRSGARPS